MPFEEYTATVLDHFLNPRNTGELKDASVSVAYTNRECGDTVKLSIKVQAGRIVDARAKTFGCAAAIACSSALTELLLGRSLEEASRLRDEDVVMRLGSLPEHKLKCSLTAAAVTRLALDELRRRDGR
jgi:NifU-like protein involved in Fe-S cluster formation